MSLRMRHCNLTVPFPFGHIALVGLRTSFGVHRGIVLKIFARSVNRMILGVVFMTARDLDDIQMLFWTKNSAKITHNIYYSR